MWMWIVAYSSQPEIWTPQYNPGWMDGWSDGHFILSHVMVFFTTYSDVWCNQKALRHPKRQIPHWNMADSLCQSPCMPRDHYKGSYYSLFRSFASVHSTTSIVSKQPWDPLMWTCSCWTPDLAFMESSKLSFSVWGFLSDITWSYIC